MTYDLQLQPRQNEYHSDRNSEGSDKSNPYNFPYTAEEDHITLQHRREQMQNHYSNDVNNPSPMSRMSSRHGSRSGSPPNCPPMQQIPPPLSTFNPDE
jgi:hypothetical protein